MMYQHRHRLVSSAYNLAGNSHGVTVGFSGTKDHNLLLPLQVCPYVYMCMHVPVSHVWACVHVYRCVFMYMCMHVPVSHVRACVHICMHVNGCLHVYIYKEEKT
jgi:hypothetical protein